MRTEIILDISTGQVATHELPPVDLEDRKAMMHDAIRSRRHRAELSGTVVGGIHVRSDERSQRKIAGAVQLFAEDGTLDVIDFEAQPGIWVTLDQPTMKAIGVAVGRHIQACFSNARILAEQVTSAENHDTLDAINIEEGWP